VRGPSLNGDFCGKAAVHGYFTLFYLRR
jgi:hypothetical protein